MHNSKRYSAHVADEVASAEANLRAAKERLATARARYAQAQERMDAAPSDAAASAEIPVEQPQTGDDPFSAADSPAADNAAAGDSAPVDSAPVGSAAEWNPPKQTSFTSSKDHIAAGVLAVVLGCLGIHKFYMGLPNAGFIMLGITVIGGIISFGGAVFVMQLIGIVEGIIYLFTPQDQFQRTYIVGRRSWF